MQEMPDEATGTEKDKNRMQKRGQTQKYISIGISIDVLCISSFSQSVVKHTQKGMCDLSFRLIVWSFNNAR